MLEGSDQEDLDPEQSETHGHGSGRLRSPNVSFNMHKQIARMRESIPSDEEDLMSPIGSPRSTAIAGLGGREKFLELKRKLQEDQLNRPKLVSGSSTANFENPNPEDYQWEIIDAENFPLQMEMEETGTGQREQSYASISYNEANLKFIEMHDQIKERDIKLLTLESRLNEMDRQIIDLEDTIRQKDKMILSKNEAITVIQDNFRKAAVEKEEELTKTQKTLFDMEKVLSSIPSTAPLEAQLTKKESELKTANAKAAKFEEKLKKVTIVLKQKNTKLSEMAETHEKWKSECQEKENQKNSVIQSLEEKVENLKDEKIMISAQSVEQVNELIQKDSQIQALQEKVDELVEEKQRISTEVTEKYHHELTQKENVIQTLRGQVDDLEEEKERISTEVAEKDHELTQKDKIVQKLQEKIDEFENLEEKRTISSIFESDSESSQSREIQNLQQNIDQLEEAKRSISAQYTEKENELTRQNLAIQGLQENIYYLEEENKKISHELDRMKEETAISAAAIADQLTQTQGNEEFESILAENSLLKSQLEEYAQSYRQMTDQLEKYQYQENDQQNSAAEMQQIQISELTNQLSLRDSELNALFQQFQHEQVLNAELRKQLEDKAKQLEETEQNLFRNSEQLARLEATNSGGQGQSSNQGVDVDVEALKTEFQVKENELTVKCGKLEEKLKKAMVMIKQKNKQLAERTSISSAAGLNLSASASASFNEEPQSLSPLPAGVDPQGQGQALADVEKWQTECMEKETMLNHKDSVIRGLQENIYYLEQEKQKIEEELVQAYAQAQAQEQARESMASQVDESMTIENLQLKSQLEELQQNYKEICEQVQDEKEKVNSEWQMRTTDLMTQIRHRDSELALLSQQLQDELALSTDFRKRLEDKSKILEEVEETLFQNSEELARLEKSMSELKSTHAQKCGELEQVNQNVEKWRQENETQLTEKNSFIQDLQQNIYDLEAQKKKIQEELFEVNKEEARAAMDQLEAALLHARNENSHLKSQLDDLEQSYSQLMLTQQFQEEQKSLSNDLIKQLEHKSKQLEQTEQNLFQNSEQLARLEAYVAELTSELNQKSAEVKQFENLLQTESIEKEAQLTQKNLQIQNLQENLHYLEQEQKKIEEELEHTKQKQSKENENSALLKSQLEELEQNYRQISDQLEKSAEDQLCLQHDREKSVNEFQIKISELMNELTTRDSELSLLSQRFDEKSKQLEATEQNFMHQNSEQLAKLEEKSAELTELIDQVEKWKIECQEKDFIIQNLQEGQRSAISICDQCVEKDNELAKRASAIQRLQEENYHLEIQTTELKISLEDAAAQVINLTSESADQNRIKEENRALTQEIESLKRARSVELDSRPAPALAPAPRVEEVEIQGQGQSSTSSSESADRDKDKLASDLHELKLRNGKLLQRLKQITDKYNSLHKEHETLKSKNEFSLDGTFQDEFLKQIREKDEVISENAKVIAEFKTEKERLDEKVDILERANEKILEMNENQNSYCGQLENQKKQLEQEISGLKWKLEELSGQSDNQYAVNAVEPNFFSEGQGQTQGQGQSQGQGQQDAAMVAAAQEIAFLQQENFRLNSMLHQQVQGQLQGQGQGHDPYTAAASVQEVPQGQGQGHEGQEVQQQSSSLEIETLRKSLENELSEKVILERKIELLQGKILEIEQSEIKCFEEALMLKSWTRQLEMDNLKYQKEMEQIYNSVSDGDMNNLKVKTLQNEVVRLVETLHERDKRCEELTIEITRMLEERDGLQLKLSNVLQHNVSLHEEVNKGKEGDPDGAAAVEIPSFDKEMLKMKLVELEGLNFAIKLDLRREREARRLVQEQLLFSQSSRVYRDLTSRNKISFSTPSPPAKRSSASVSPPSPQQHSPSSLPHPQEYLPTTAQAPPASLMTPVSISIPSTPQQI